MWLSKNMSITFCIIKYDFFNAALLLLYFDFYFCISKKNVKFFSGPLDLGEKTFMKVDDMKVFEYVNVLKRFATVFVDIF